MFMSLLSKNNCKTHLENHFSKLKNGSVQKIKVKNKKKFLKLTAECFT